MKKFLLVLLLSLPIMLGGALEDVSGISSLSLEKLDGQAFASSLPEHAVSGSFDLRFEEHAKREERIGGWEESFIYHRTVSPAAFFQLIGFISREINVPASVLERSVPFNKAPPV